MVMASKASDFPGGHFDDGSFIEESEPFYREAAASEDSPLRIAYALPRTGSVPDYATFQHKLEPAPGSWPARVVQACVPGLTVPSWISCAFRQIERKQCRDCRWFGQRGLGCWLLAALAAGLECRVTAARLGGVGTYRGELCLRGLPRLRGQCPLLRAHLADPPGRPATPRRRAPVPVLSPEQSDVSHFFSRA